MNTITFTISNGFYARQDGTNSRSRSPVVERWRRPNDNTWQPGRFVAAYPAIADRRNLGGTKEAQRLASMTLSGSSENACGRQATTHSTIQRSDGRFEHADPVTQVGFLRSAHYHWQPIWANRGGYGVCAAGLPKFPASRKKSPQFGMLSTACGRPIILRGTAAGG